MKMIGPNSIPLGFSQREVNAYIYQQVSELKALLPQDAFLGFVVKDVGNKRGELSVALVFVWKELRFESIGKSRDIFDAISKARAGIQAHLAAICDQMIDGQGRDSAISDLLKSRNIH